MPSRPYRTFMFLLFNSRPMRLDPLIVPSCTDELRDDPRRGIPHDLAPDGCRHRSPYLRSWPPDGTALGAASSSQVRPSCHIGMAAAPHCASATVWVGVAPNSSQSCLSASGLGSSPGVMPSFSCSIPPATKITGTPAAMAPATS